VCGDFDGDGQLTDDDLTESTFESCENLSEVFIGDSCKAYDFNNDRVVDDLDRMVFDCLQDEGGNECCPSDNGFVGIVFGGITLDGDRTIGQVASTDLPGVAFYGASAGDLAGWDVESAGDFNRDGFGDVLISGPGKRFQDENGRDRMGVVWLIFGGTHLYNKAFSLDQVGTEDLPGITFQSPFVIDRPNEAPTQYVGTIGDINNDGFDDIAIGIPKADFIDQALPQDPNDPGVDPNIGRRPDDGTIYIIYGNNVGTNR
jgi:hypothetical protein